MSSINASPESELRSIARDFLDGMAIAIAQTDRLAQRIEEMERGAFQVRGVLKENSDLIARNGDLIDQVVNREPPIAEVVHIKPEVVNVKPEDRKETVFMRGISLITTLACAFFVTALVVACCGLIAPGVTLFLAGTVIALTIPLMAID